jgi:HPt (histidine-containing phosphotransfer) domain-containing protein
MSSDTPTPDAIPTAIQAIWQRNLPQTRERIALLQRAATQLSNARTLDSDLHAEALSIAHKLAGSLGMFGYTAGTEHARAIEIELSHPGLPQPERLQRNVDALVASLPFSE